MTVTRAVVVVAGMVVSRILKANIPVQNGIVHLIDKPLMVVARSLYDYLMEEGRDPANRLHEFAMLVTLSSCSVQLCSGCPLEL